MQGKVPPPPQKKKVNRERFQKRSMQGKVKKKSACVLKGGMVFPESGLSAGISL